MPPITNAISSLSATPYVDAFTTGEILGFVVLIICTQIVITWIAVRSIKNYLAMVGASIEKGIIDSHEDVTTGIQQVLEKIK